MKKLVLNYKVNCEMYYYMSTYYYDLKGFVSATVVLLGVSNFVGIIGTYIYGAYSSV